MADTDPEVAFYISSEQGAKARLVLACRLAETAYNRGHKVYMHLDSERQVDEMDDLLWSFKQNSFVPHTRHPAAANDTSPVLLGWRDPPSGFDQVLINVTDAVPAFYRTFRRVLEVVSQDPEVLRLSRERFRCYREHALDPQVHRL